MSAARVLEWPSRAIRWRTRSSTGGSCPSAAARFGSSQTSRPLLAQPFDCRRASGRVSGQKLGGGQAHLVTDRSVAGDGLAGRSGGVRVGGGECLGGGQAHFVTDLTIAG